MHKKLVVLLGVFLLIFAPSTNVFANENSDIQTYLDNQYVKSLNNDITTVKSEQDVYSLLLKNQKAVSFLSSGKIVFNINTLDKKRYNLSSKEIELINDFVNKINASVELGSLKIERNLKISFDGTKKENLNSTRSSTFEILSECRSHSKTLKSVYDNAPFGQRNLIAGTFFTDKVRSRGDWDYKSYLGTKTPYFVTDMNTTMTGETIGNFHYGYVGKTLWPKFVLNSAAGAYQIKSGTSALSWGASFFDDPNDQNDINRGIDTYDKEH